MKAYLKRITVLHGKTVRGKIKSRFLDIIIFLFFTNPYVPNKFVIVSLRTQLYNIQWTSKQTGEII